MCPGTASRFALVLQGGSWQLFKRDHPVVAIKLRRAIMLASAWSDRRHSIYEEDPFQWASLPDTRINVDHRLAIVRRAAKVNPKCNEAWFVGPLIEATLGDPDQLVTKPVYAKFFHGWADAVKVSTGCVETLHKRCKDIAHKQKSWTNFTAEVVNNEAKLQETNAGG